MIQRRGLLQEPAKPRDSAPAGERVEWIRDQIRNTARDLEMLVMFGALDPDRAGDRLGQLADAFADQIGATDDVTLAAVQAEQQVSAAILRRMMDDLRRQVFGLGRVHAPGAEIMGAACTICERHGVFVPTELLLAACKSIAYPAAKPVHRTWRRLRVR